MFRGVQQASKLHQRQSSTKKQRREGKEKTEEMVVAVQIYGGSIATAIIKYAPFGKPSQIFMLGNLYALFYPSLTVHSILVLSLFCY